MTHYHQFVGVTGCFFDLLFCIIAFLYLSLWHKCSVLCRTNCSVSSTKTRVHGRRMCCVFERTSRATFRKQEKLIQSCDPEKRLSSAAGDLLMMSLTMWRSSQLISTMTEAAVQEQRKLAWGHKWADQLIIRFRLFTPRHCWRLVIWRAVWAISMIVKVFISTVENVWARLKLPLIKKELICFLE